MVSDHPAQPLLLLPPEQKGLPVAVTLSPVAANTEATRIFKGAKETGNEFLTQRISGPVVTWEVI